MYIWTTGNWTGVWVLFVCWCTLSSCVSPSSSSSTYSPSSIFPPAARNENRSFSWPSLFDLVRTMAHVLDQRQTGSCSEGIFIYWSSWSSIDPLFFFPMGAILIESLGLWCYKRSKRMKERLCKDWSCWLIYRLFRQDRNVVRDDYCLVWCEYFVFFKIFCIFKEYDLNVFYDGIYFISC